LVEHARKKEARKQSNVSEADKAETAEDIEDMESKKKSIAEMMRGQVMEMKTYVRIPSQIPKPDPEWMLKKFRGMNLAADEIEEYMKWKHQFKLDRFKKSIKGVHQGTLLKVHQETNTKKVACELGAGCSGWNKEVYNGFFARCGLMDPFIIWN
jgi:hypothetical protein